MSEKSKGILKILAVPVALVVGGLIGHQLPPSKEQVRTALYTACVNGQSYSPDADNRGNASVCNRRSIDSSIASIYDGTYLEPLAGAETRGKYEEFLSKYKRR